jgi:hypothetical protein
MEQHFRVMLIGWFYTFMRSFTAHNIIINFLIIGKMVIFTKYIIWKIFLRCPFSRDAPDSSISCSILYTTISFYISNRTLILPIRHMNTTIPKKTGSIELISTVGPITFLLHTGLFQSVVHVVLHHKRPL